ncbi:hypothetical protein ACSS6W_009242 [Trichoderma asperelloides]
MLPRKDGSLVNWRAINFYESDPNAGFRDVIAELFAWRALPNSAFLFTKAYLLNIQFLIIGPYAQSRSEPSGQLRYFVNGSRPTCRDMVMGRPKSNLRPDESRMRFLLNQRRELVNTWNPHGV